MPHPNELEIERIAALDDEFVSALRRMLVQLAPESKTPSQAYLAKVLACPTNTQLCARLKGVTVGTLTLTMLMIPTGISGWIADVVVDTETRGRGIGEKLVLEAINVAREKGARYVDLSSRPVREAANRLYQRLGFEKRDTNYYRYML